jgi:hypothetical protein
MCSNWTLDQYRRLELPFTQAYRKILCLPAKFPTEVMYLPTSMAGMGLPRLSDIAQIRKWESFQRCTAVHGDPAASVEDMLNRVPVQQAVGPEDPLRLLVSPPPEEWSCALTARSLLEWTAESGLQIARREFATTEEEIHNRANQTTITELAQKLKLWPDPRELTEIEDLMPLRLFATDGSFKAEPNSLADILTSEAALRDAGEGAGGFVCVPRNPKTLMQSVQITSDEPEPGMNAFTWELLTQVIAVQMTQYQPHFLPGSSDCTSAITRVNLALKSYINPLAHTRGGLWATAAHVHADCDQPRRFYHVKAHPERYPARTANPTIKDKIIYIADAVAGLAPGEADRLRNGILKFKLGTTHMETGVHVLKLQNILNEIIPLNHWHLRTADLHKTPVLNDIIDYQHRAAQVAWARKRDIRNEEQRWESTALSFASKVHPAKDKSFWAAARRSLIVYDWLGHGRNRAKMCNLHPAQKQQIEKCPHCSALDSQAHCMLECTHPPFTAPRLAAKQKQGKIAQKLREKHADDEHLQYFIEQLHGASWTDSPNISRLWLGTWTMSTLQRLLGQPADTPMSAHQRFKYITVVKKMTKPLLIAYQTILNINTRSNTTSSKHQAEDLPLYDHHPTDTHTELPITDPDHPEHSEVLTERIQEIGLLFVQHDEVDRPGITGPNLNLASKTIRLNPFDVCDAANCLDSNYPTSDSDVDGTF